MLASPICWGSSWSGSRHPSLSISVQKLERKYFHAVISKEFHVIYWPSLKISCTKCQRKYCIKTVRLTNIAFLTLTVLRFFWCSLLQRGAIKIKSEFSIFLLFFLLLTVKKYLFDSTLVTSNPLLIWTGSNFPCIWHCLQLTWTHLIWTPYSLTIILLSLGW